MQTSHNTSMNWTIYECDPVANILWLSRAELKVVVMNYAAAAAAAAAAAEPVGVNKAHGHT